MRQRRPAPLPVDLLHLAQDSFGTADQVIVSGALEAMDRIYAELTRTTPAKVERAPVVEHSGVGLVRMKHPALRS